MKNKLIKDIDENLWLRLKAVSSINGRTLSKEINNMIDTYTYNELQKFSKQQEQERNQQHETINETGTPSQ